MIGLSRNLWRMRTWTLAFGFCLLAVFVAMRTLLPGHVLHRMTAYFHAVHIAASRSRNGSDRVDAASDNGQPVLYRGKVAVLMWHHLDPSVRGGDIVTPDQFAAQLDYLERKGIRFITLQQFRAFENGGSVPDNAALITFDDGYESFYKYAYPILKQRSLGGVCFVITGDMRPNAHVYVPHMTPQEIADMEKTDPQIEVQPHTDALHYKIDRKHDGLTAYLVKNGTKETEAQYVERITQDTKRCVDTLKKLNSHAIDTFAYPYGLYTPTVEKVLEQAGIRYAFTVRPGLVGAGTDAMAMPRINGGSPAMTPKALYKAIVRAANDQPYNRVPEPILPVRPVYKSGFRAFAA